MTIPFEIALLKISQSIGRFSAIQAGEGEFLGLTSDEWISLGISLLIVLVSVTLVDFLVVLILKKITRKTPTTYDALYLQSIRPLIRWILGLAGLWIATARLDFINPSWQKTLSQIYLGLIVLVVVLAIWKLIDIFVLWYRGKVDSHVDIKEKEAVLILAERFFRILVLAVGVVIVLDNFGVDVSALLTALGLGGLAISLAAQDTIANMISGVIILIDQPFRVGDRIEVQGLNTSGDVVEIGLRSTRVRTLDNRMVVIPNLNLSKNNVTNYNFPDPSYREQTEIRVALGADLDRVRSEIIQKVQSLDGVMPEKPVSVTFVRFDNSVVVLQIFWWVAHFTNSKVNDVNEAVCSVLEQIGVEMPPKTLAIELKTSQTEENKPETAET
jgi:MscS family membrane protein